MSEFDSKAREWDANRMHTDRSHAIAEMFQKLVPLNHNIKALEYGAGTGILSFMLHSKLGRITLMDSSREMIRVCDEKIDAISASNMHTICIDLENEDYSGHFDLIFNQMVMHHVNDIGLIVRKFYGLLNQGGTLAIADLYPEDGSFHGPEAKVHLGFDPVHLSKVLSDSGFKNIEHHKCYTLKKENGREYDIFLLIARKE